MKALLFIFGAVMMLSPSSFSQDASNDGTLEVTTAGQAQFFDRDKEESIKFWLHKLMLSALYQDQLITDSTLREWQREVTAQTRLYCRYSSRATLAMPERRTLLFDEVLLPIHSNAPDFIYIKRGETVMRLTKYNAWVYVKLATEAGLPVHPTWLNVERGRW